MNKNGRIKHWQIVTIYLVLYDLVAVTGSYFLALLLRFDFQYTVIPQVYLMSWMHFAPCYAVFSVLVFQGLKLYKSIWRFASFTELKRITAATLITAIVHAIMITLVLHRMPISYYLIGAFLQFFFIVAIRFSYRFILLLRGTKKQSGIKRVMLIGNHSIIGAT